jgi:hypothetical protein
MKKMRPLLFSVLALLAGWAIGSYTSDHFYDKWIKRYQARNAHDGVSDGLAALKALRAGDTNQVAELLENQLDTQIMALGTVLQETPAAQRPAADTQLLDQLRDYRFAHPRKTSRSEIDQRVAGVLSLTNASNQQ